MSVAASTNPTTAEPAGRGSVRKSHTTQRRDCQEHSQHTVEEQLLKIQEDIEVERQEQPDLADEEVHQSGRYVEYNKHPVTEGHTRSIVASYLQESPLWTAPGYISFVPHKSPNPDIMNEHRLLQVQDTIEEEKFIGADSPPDMGPSTTEHMKQAILTFLEDTPEEPIGEDLLLMHLGQRQLRPILTMPCSCQTPEECCWEERMLALQDLLQDEKEHGHDF